MNHTPIPSFIGVDKDNPARLIPETRCSDASNVTFEDYLAKSRFGYGAFANNLTDPVMAIIFYEKPYNNENYLLAVTTKDIYVYSQSLGEFQYRTKNYSTGTVSIDSGSLDTVDGNGTQWASLTGTPSSWEIGFGTTDINLVTEWYRISAVASDTEITLDAEMTASMTSSQYVIRQCSVGDVDDIVFFATPYDDTIGDKCLLITNGVDPIQYWDGTSADFEDLIDLKALACTITGGSATVTTTDTTDLVAGMDITGHVSIPAGTTISVVDNSTTLTMSQTATGTATTYAKIYFTGDAPNYAKHIAYFGSVGFEHTITSNVLESGEQRTLTVELSNAGTLVWRGIYYDLLNTNDPIRGVESLQNRLIFYKDKSISEAWMTGGGNTDPLDWVQNKVNIGTPAMRTVQIIENYHIFMSLQGIYAYDGNTAVPIADGVVRYFLNNISKPYANRAFAFTMKRLNLYVLMVPTDSGYPDLCMVYNYALKAWSIWEFNNTIYSFGAWKKTEAPTFAQTKTAGTTWEDWQSTNLRWRDLIVQDDDETFLLGDINGNVYTFDETFSDDNGTQIVSTFTTRDYPLNDQKHAVRLAELVLGFRDQDAGQIMVRASVDFGGNWCDYILVDMDSPNDYYEEIVNFIMRGTQARFQIQNYLGSSFSIENMIIGWNEMGVKR